MPSLRRRNRTGKRTQWDIRYWQNGVRKTFTIGEADKRTAERIYRDFCVRFAEGKFDGTGMAIDTSAEVHDGPTLSELAMQTRIYAEANKSSKTLEREQLSFDQFIKVLGDIPVAELTPAKIEEYKAARLKGVTASTVNIEIRALNTALNQAATLGWLNGTSKQHFKQIRRPEPEPPRWLSPDEIHKLLGVSDMEYCRFLVFLLNTGCRRNEALGVTWEDIDLQKRQIVIRGQIGKMGKRRSIPINDVLLKMLEKWPGCHEGKLFPDLGPNQVAMTFRRRCRDVDLPRGISIHTLRATFACHLIAKGVDIYTVSKLLGHSSVKVTERHYLALDPAHVREAVNHLNFDIPSDTDG